MDHHDPLSSPRVRSSPPPGLMPSSPDNSYLSPTRTAGRRKEKRNPSVTPRRFGRFFTPRPSLVATGRSILGSLHGAVLNHRQPISPQSLAGDLSSDPICPSPSERVARNQRHDCAARDPQRGEPVVKRRRVLADGASIPQLNLDGRAFGPGPASPSLSRHANVGDDADGRQVLELNRKGLTRFFRDSRSAASSSTSKTPSGLHALVSWHAEPPSTPKGYRPRPLRKFHTRGLCAELLSREHGSSAQAGQQHLSRPACDLRVQTAGFYSHPYDVHFCSHEPDAGSEAQQSFPFSLTSAHTVPVAAVGDESGHVSFFSTTESVQGQAKVRSKIKVHDNAIMGVDFSEDDMRLATACGDRSGRILDVETQRVAAELPSGHWDSLRQVSFQPGRANGSIIATSDRIGCIHIWDLRCPGSSVSSFSTRTEGGVRRRNPALEPFMAATVNTIDQAHIRTVEGITSPSSVTAIQWMPAGREHLLLTASEANASIKLWDSRYLKPRRQARAQPLAATPEPATHAWRSYGITSLALGRDAARLYAVCKDSTVYAYSTTHLMLGHAPELVDGAIKRRPTGAEGLGPLYGLKHDAFRAQTFYVKCSIRRAPGASELLALGSSNSCALLFPTDERYVRAILNQAGRLLQEQPHASSLGTPSAFSTLPGSSPVPIFRNAGTALIRGHSREVTAMSWSHDGSRLVTASDDCFVRQWQDGRDGQARHLRAVGEFGPDRYMAGWANVSEDWDAMD